MRRSAWFVALGLVGAACFGHGAWILLKAEIAQVLLDRAWERTLSGESGVAPWSWADTWPVARLAAPRLGAEAIVLAGASGAVLAFGPGHLDGSAVPGEDGNTVIAGHRDTHFAFLRDLEPGDEISLETAAHGRIDYRVESFAIVDAGDASPAWPTAGNVLTLVTCYPFDAVVPGGPLRYVVRAMRSSPRKRESGFS